MEKNGEQIEANTPMKSSFTMAAPTWNTYIFLKWHFLIVLLTLQALNRSFHNLQDGLISSFLHTLLLTYELGTLPLLLCISDHPKSIQEAHLFVNLFQAIDLAGCPGSQEDFSVN